jgi:hypothetical protein
MSPYGMKHQFYGEGRRIHAVPIDGGLDELRLGYLEWK